MVVFTGVFRTAVHKPILHSPVCTELGTNHSLNRKQTTQFIVFSTKQITIQVGHSVIEKTCLREVFEILICRSTNYASLETNPPLLRTDVTVSRRAI